MNKVILGTFLASLYVTGAGAPARAQDKFYAIIFGVQDGRNRPNQAHSFATFVRVRPEPPQGEVVDQATISWLPAAGVVRLRYRAEAGTNHPLKESIERVGPGRTIAQWGPFEIREELFHRAKRQAEFLSAGGTSYKALDFFARPMGRATNCEHAILDIILEPGQKHIRTWTARGHEGSYTVAEHLKDWMIEPHVRHDWVNASLGLEGYAIARNNWLSSPETIVAQTRAPFSATAVAGAPPSAASGVASARPASTNPK